MAPEQEVFWVQQAQKGDQHAFARLVDAYQTPIYNLAYRMLGNPTEAEDAAQETFLRAYTRLETYDPSRKFSSWILSIASHHCVDRLRRRRGAWVSMEEVMASRWLPDDHPKPEEQLVQRDQRSLIRGMLEQLPPQYRIVIVLRYWYDLSYEEIAEMTESTVSAIKSRLHRARLVMATQIEQYQAAVPDEPNDAKGVSEHAMSRSF
ncbi:MAG: sigma-70 family RNA polymerase sigma factor [Anaerolineae bacterium]